MSLKDEYNTDVTIDGKTYALDFVENYLDAETNETVIKKRWIAADGKSFKFTYKRFPLPPRPVAVPPAAAGKPKPKANGEVAPPLDEDTAPAIELNESGKTGLIGRFLGKGKRKGK